MVRGRNVVASGKALLRRPERTCAAEEDGRKLKEAEGAGAQALMAGGTLRSVLQAFGDGEFGGARSHRGHPLVVQGFQRELRDGVRLGVERRCAPVTKAA